MELTAYTKQFTDRIRRLAETYLQAVPLSTTERCCISLRPNEISLLATHHHADTDEIIFLEKLKYEDAASLKLVLAGMIQKHQLQLVPVYWLLNPTHYDLNLIDSMPVPKSEMITALSWRIRSLVKYPIEDAVVDYFELPAKKNSPNAPLIAAVTAQKSQMQQQIKLIKECGLKLTTIDIPELAMQNLSALYENDEKSTAFLYFYADTMILNISYQKLLYFTRRIAITPNGVSNIDFEKLSLEILRYFDFFRSQWRLASPTRIFAATESGDATLLAKSLTERLLNNVVPYTLNSAVISSDNAAKINSDYLLDYGCLLRKENSDATARN